MRVQLYQAIVQNPKAFLIDFENTHQSDMFFELCEFLKDENIKVTKLEIKFHDKKVKITYINNGVQLFLEAPKDAYIMSLNKGTLMFSLKANAYSELGLIDDPGEVR